MLLKAVSACVLGLSLSLSAAHAQTSTAPAKKEEPKKEEVKKEEPKKDEAKKEEAKKKDETKKDAAKTAAVPTVEVKTSEGVIKIELDEKAAPVTVKNFLGYVNDKFYDGTIFHRVIDGFMIQGGGFVVKDGKFDEKKTKDPITNEAKNGLKNDRGTIAMARTGDPNSATAQFYINLVNNDSLNHPKPDGHGYAVFGKVVSGMDVVDKIGKTPTTMKNGMMDVPANDVKILSVTTVSPKVN